MLQSLNWLVYYLHFCFISPEWKQIWQIFWRRKIKPKKLFGHIKQFSLFLFSDSISVGYCKLKYRNYVTKNCWGEDKSPLPQWRYHCEDDFGTSIMPKYCVAVSFTKHNFMHEKTLSSFRFPDKLKQSKWCEKWVQAKKRVVQMAVNGNLME